VLARDFEHAERNEFRHIAAPKHRASVVVTRRSVRGQGLNLAIEEDHRWLSCRAPWHSLQRGVSLNRMAIIQRGWFAEVERYPSRACGNRKPRRRWTGETLFVGASLLQLLHKLWRAICRRPNVEFRFHSRLTSVVAPIDGPGSLSLCRC